MFSAADTYKYEQTQETIKKQSRWVCFNNFRYLNDNGQILAPVILIWCNFIVNAAQKHIKYTYNIIYLKDRRPYSAFNNTQYVRCVCFKGSSTVLTVLISFYSKSAEKFKYISLSCSMSMIRAQNRRKMLHQVQSNRRIMSRHVCCFFCLLNSLNLLPLEENVLGKVKEVF